MLHAFYHYNFIHHIGSNVIQQFSSKKVLKWGQMSLPKWPSTHSSSLATYRLLLFWKLSLFLPPGLTHTTLWPFPPSKLSYTLILSDGMDVKGRSIWEETRLATSHSPSSWPLQLDWNLFYPSIHLDAYSSQLTNATMSYHTITGETMRICLAGAVAASLAVSTSAFLPGRCM